MRDKFHFRLHAQRAAWAPVAALAQRAALTPVAAWAQRTILAPAAALAPRATLAPAAAWAQRGTLAPVAAWAQRAILAPVAWAQRAALAPRDPLAQRVTWAPVTILFLVPGLACAQDVQAGADSYAKHCAVCHGREARGGQGPSLVRPAYGHGVDDASVARTIREGFPEGGMPAFGAALSDPQVAGVVAFLRQKRAEAPPSTRPTVPLAYQPLGVPKGVVKTELHDFRVETVAKVGEPYSFAFLPDGRILITEMAGNLRIVDKGKLQLEPVPDAPGGDGLGLRGGGGRSLLDVTIDPDYKSNGWIYLVTSHAIKNAQGKLDGVARINRGRIRDGRWVDNQILTEFSIDVTTGLRMAFDSKRFLYIGTSFPDPDYFAPAEVGKTPPQLLSSSWGKILRMTADGKVPPDNPFVNTPGAFPYIYAFGIRAPLGLAVDRNGELWESEDGPRGGDELNHIKAGKNYGWPVVTWGHRYDAIPVPGNPEQEGMEPPVGSWSPSPAVSAIAVYGGSAFPRWKDNIIMGSLMQMDLLRIVLDGDRAVAQETILHGLGRIRDVRVSAEGYIYLLIDGGQLVRLVPAN